MRIPFLSALITSAALCFAMSSTFAQESRPFDRPMTNTENWTTGPAVGERIPEFAGTDQNGIRQTFDDIKGPNGAMIIFYRSADW